MGGGAIFFFFIVVIGWIVLISMIYSSGISVIEISILEARGVNEEEKQQLIPVDVSVYYETLCPHSQQFITNRLLPAYLEAPRLMNLHLVPYGNARTKQTPEGYEFTCQHGPIECTGNRIHSCAVELLENQTALLEYVACMMGDELDPEASGEECAESLAIPWGEIADCAEGPLGNELLYANGVRTESVRPPVRGVPTITLNGVPQRLGVVFRDLVGEVCKLFPDSKPEECLRRTNT